MTVWFVVPVAAEAAFRAAYDATVAGETLGALQLNDPVTLGFTGSSRCTPGQRDAVLAAVPSAAAYDAWPPPGGWAYPTN